MNQSLIDAYRNIVGTSKDLDIQIKAFIPIPTATEYVVGTITRYFAQQANQPTGEITEVDQVTFNKIKSHPFWLIVQVPWRIAGSDQDVFDERGIRAYTSVSTANELSIKLAARTMPLIVSKLPNVLQFWKGSITNKIVVSTLPVSSSM